MNFRPFYRTEQLIITRPNNHTLTQHANPPPSLDYTYFSSLFDKEFMHQVNNPFPADQLELSTLLLTCINSDTICLSEISRFFC